jgi:hypothetical protein
VTRGADCSRVLRDASDQRAPENRRYVEGQRRYLRESRHWRHATVIIDNTDLDTPRIIEAETGPTARPFIA